MAKTPKLDASEVEDVVRGCGQPHGPRGQNICSSGLQASASAAHQIANEGVDAAIGGGMESITMTPRGFNPQLLERMPGLYMVMGNTAEVVIKRYKISRQSQDEYALLSQQRTARVRRRGSKVRSLRYPSPEPSSTESRGK
jgi:acetyl-CoA C-acetyltransferase